MSKLYEEINSTHCENSWVFKFMVKDLLFSTESIYKSSRVQKLYWINFITAIHTRTLYFLCHSQKQSISINLKSNLQYFNFIILTPSKRCRGTSLLIYFSIHRHTQLCYIFHVFSIFITMTTVNPKDFNVRVHKTVSYLKKVYLFRGT